MQALVDVAAVLRLTKWVARVEVGRNDHGGVGLGAAASSDIYRPQSRGERLHLGELRLWGSIRVGQAKVELKRVVPVRILPGQRVVIGITPGYPASRARQQAVVQDLAVVAGGGAVAGVVRADAKLLEHDRLAIGTCQLALECRGVVLADLVVARRIDVRTHEIAEPGRVGEREPGVVAPPARAPRAVAERERLTASCRPDRVTHDLRPCGYRLARGGAAVD